jgi:hypothetical protein
METWNAMTTEEQEQVKADLVEEEEDRAERRPISAPLSTSEVTVRAVCLSSSVPELLFQKMILLRRKRAKEQEAAAKEKKRQKKTQKRELSLQRILVGISREEEPVASPPAAAGPPTLSTTTPAKAALEGKEAQLGEDSPQDATVWLLDDGAAGSADDVKQREQFEEKRRDNPAEQWPSLAKHVSDPRRRAWSWGQNLSKELAWWGQDASLHDWNACELCSCGASVENFAPFKEAEKRACNLEDNYLLLVDLCARGQPKGVVLVVHFHARSSFTQSSLRGRGANN